MKLNLPTLCACSYSLRFLMQGWILVVPMFSIEIISVLLNVIADDFDTVSCKIQLVHEMETAST